MLKVSALQIILLIVLNLVISTVTCADSAVQEGVMVKYLDGNLHEHANEESKSPENDDGLGFFKGICEELLEHIGSYLVDPVASLGFLNKKFYGLFHEKFSLGYFVNQRLRIDKFNFESVDKNEKEFHAILNLTWPGADSFLLFKVLLKDFISLNRRYTELARPLRRYILRTYKCLNDHQKFIVDDHLSRKYYTSLEPLLSRVCGEYGDFYSVFDLLEKNKPDLLEYIDNFKNKRVLFEFFKMSAIRAIEYVIAVASGLDAGANVLTYRFSNWISNCIVYDAPQDNYDIILNATRFLLPDLVKPLFLSLDTPESEFPRIHSQVASIVELSKQQVGERYIDFITLINDIRFGTVSETPTPNLFDLTSLEKNSRLMIIKVALLGNKRDIFHAAYNVHCQKERNSNKYIRPDQILNDILASFKYLDTKHFQSEYFRMVYEIIAANANTFFSPAAIYDDSLPKILLNVYAPIHLERNGENIAVTFDAPENFLALGFPPEIRIGLDDDYHTCSFLQIIFQNMKVLTEDTLFSFLSDYLSIGIFTHKITASLKVIEIVSSSPALVEQVMNSGIKLLFRLIPEDIKSNQFYLPRIEDSNRVFELMNLDWVVTKIKRVEDFRQIERIQKKTIAQCFLGFESSYIKINSRYFNEFDYIDWRSALAYWINSDQRERIREIGSPDIIKMLRYEFPAQMTQIFGV